MAAGMGKSIIPVTYAVVSNPRSMDFCRAFAQGCGGKISTHQNMLLHGAVAGFWLPEIYRAVFQPDHATNVLYLMWIVLLPPAGVRL